LQSFQCPKSQCPKSLSTSGYTSTKSSKALQCVHTHAIYAGSLLANSGDFCGSCSDHRKDYPFRAHFESPDHEVQIFLTRDNDEMGVLLGWELYLGTLSGNMTSPIYTSNDWPTFKDNIRGKDPRFNEQFQCIRGWLVTCQADHQDWIVSTLRESRFLPKTLLDVGLVDKGRYVL
jgi:hypothetical protein